MISATPLHSVPQNGVTAFTTDKESAVTDQGNTFCCPPRFLLQCLPLMELLMLSDVTESTDQQGSEPLHLRVEAAEAAERRTATLLLNTCSTCICHKNLRVDTVLHQMSR